MVCSPDTSKRIDSSLISKQQRCCSGVPAGKSTATAGEVGAAPTAVDTAILQREVKVWLKQQSKQVMELFEMRLHVRAVDAETVVKQAVLPLMQALVGTEQSAHLQMVVELLRYVHGSQAQIRDAAWLTVRSYDDPGTVFTRAGRCTLPGAKCTGTRYNIPV